MPVSASFAIRPTRARIDLDALRFNLAEVRRLAPKVDVVGVVKANAYGHGAVPVARALEEQGVAFLAVALVEEALELREAGLKAPMLVLGGAYGNAWEPMVSRGLVPAVFRPEHVEGMHRAAEKLNTVALVHLKLDTGMGRIGIPPDELDAFLKAIGRFDRVRIDGLLSHFANADLADAAMTRLQVERFSSATKTLERHGVKPRYRHLSNSAGVLDLENVRDGIAMNLVRPGLMLYGISPAAWMKDRAMFRPVMSWVTAITHIKTVETGTPISYGGTWTASRKSRIATLPVGYADGYGRKFSNRAHVLVHGRPAKIAGRVCMDMCMVDVTDIPHAQVNDEVVLMGRQGNEELTAETLAEWAETIPYEIVCGVSARVPRV